MNGQAELVMDAQAIIGEGPHWDHAQGRLYWVDIESKEMRVYDAITRTEQIHTFEQRVSAVVPAAEGGWILALQDGIYSFKEHQQPELIYTVEADLPGNRLNDAKCDSAGRLWFGTMSMDGTPQAGSLYVMETNGKVRRVFTDIGTSNGLAWDDSRGLMYYIDTATGGVDVMNYDRHTGEVSGRKQVCKLQEGAGFPDGMTIDSEGMIWVAHWGGACVSRWNPLTGEQIGVIEVPAMNVTSCAFGGEHLDELYITTARNGMNAEQLERWPLTGGLFKAKLDVKGVPADVFGGKGV
ncbi:SMP-30/gluconolactonase/LRE family protein [Paenibacillus sp. PK3_47]|uniref:SMP-30/gluconolactonase/LRE family protein n=1 Tax=Paenibacillus sp. PK3_47 TaxID=2072642 RepID=UPI00201DD9A3|nr:SMP-30/gluconolactonase/LRE family protein [Paenibacillus sp. PK3_47]